jgi:quinol monooxygenase YgiN
MSRVAVIARIPAAPGQRGELAAALQMALDNVESEPGTRYYILHEDTKDADTLWMYELYEAQSDLEAHMGAAWFSELGPLLGPHLGGRPELTFLNPVGGKGL